MLIMNQLKHVFTCTCLSLFIVLMSVGSAFSGANPIAPAAPYTIQSLNTPYPEFVSSGDSVLVKVMGPSTKAVLKSSVRLNGNDVTQVFSSDGEPGSMTGMISGLTPGVNIIQVYPSKKSKEVLAKLTVSTAILPQLDCSGLTSLTIPLELLPSPSDVVLITSAVPATATTTLPEHCIVQGKINPRIGVNDTPFAIGFELRLPSRWSGRFFFQGGGGNDGSYANATGSPGFGGPSALSRGFATTKTDGGHSGGSAANFGFDPQARVDHAYNAFDKTAGTAKAIIDLYYGKMPDKSYFAGCSEEEAGRG
jgi:hypothetical protein